MVRLEEDAAPGDQKHGANPAHMALAALAAGAIVLAIVLVGLSTGHHRAKGAAVPTARPITPLPQGRATAVLNCSAVSGGQEVLQGSVTNPLPRNPEVIAITIRFQSASGTNMTGLTVTLGPSRIADFTKVVPQNLGTPGIVTPPGQTGPDCQAVTSVITVLLPGIPYTSNGPLPTPTSLVGRPLR